jgi:tryptophan 2,3-dioxygenase
VRAARPGVARHGRGEVEHALDAAKRVVRHLAQQRLHFRLVQEPISSPASSFRGLSMSLRGFEEHQPRFSE